MSDRDCKHGHLAQSCEICELEAERDALRAEVAEYKTTMGPCRAKCWHEMNTNEKIDQLARSLESLSKQFLEVGQLVVRLTHHQHNSVGLPYSVLARLEAAENALKRGPVFDEVERLPCREEIKEKR